MCQRPPCTFRRHSRRRKETPNFGTRSSRGAHYAQSFEQTPRLPPKTSIDRAPRDSQGRSP
eukprot:6230869-Alexandrium_andersonii.AAC.1